MKKTILLILAVLPIILLVVIAFAGQILAYYQHIPVEKVEFVDRAGTAYTDETVFSVEQGATKETRVIVYPLLASNQKVAYVSQDTSICTIDPDGVIRGVHYGTTTVTVITADGDKKAVLNVEVKASIPFAVTLEQHELTMNLFTNAQLTHVVDAPVAVNKNVTYVSDNPDVVSVNASGKLIARAPGKATVTITTVSGGLTDTCEITVENRLPPIYFAATSDEITRNPDSGYYITTSKSLDLSPFLVLHDSIKPEDVKIIADGEATVDGKIITFLKPNKILTLTLYTGSEDAKENVIEINIIYTDI